MQHFDDQDLLDEHRKIATNMGVSSTTTYFINGVKINGAKVRAIEQILVGEKFHFDASDPE